MKNHKKINPDTHITTQTDIKDNISKKAIHFLITEKCNSNCIFCFSEKELTKKHLPINIINKNLQKYFDLGYTILVLSGGEPTIHPNFIEIISSAKSIGYENIKIITNGRMFAYKKFLKKTINAGLDEATISLHSHIPKIQDYLSNTKGSFGQAITGIKNCIDSKLDIKINIVVNKHNLKTLKKSIAFFSQLGIKKIGLLRIMPYGKAWKNKDSLFYNHEKNIKYLNEALDFSKQNKIDIRTNRFDLKLFKNYPEFIQHPFKFINEVESRINEFKAFTEKGENLFCYPERCNYCFLKNFCKELHEKDNKIKKGIKTKEDDPYLDKDNLINPIKFAKDYIEKNFEIPIIKINKTHPKIGITNNWFKIKSCQGNTNLCKVKVLEIGKRSTQMDTNYYLNPIWINKIKPHIQGLDLSLHSGTTQIFTDDKQFTLNELHILKAEIILCKFIGARELIFHLKDEKLDEKENKKLKTIIDFSKKYNIKMVYEANATSNPNLILNFLKDFPDIGYNLDLGHLNIQYNRGFMGYKLDNFIQKIKNRVIYIHAHNNNGKIDEHKALSEGTLNWKKILDMLDLTKVKKIISETRSLKDDIKNIKDLKKNLMQSNKK